MASNLSATMTRESVTWRDYLELCKPKVVALMLLTAWVGMFLAKPGLIALSLFIYATVGIACAAGSAAIINHLVDRHIDTLMMRTKKRPIATGKIAPKQAILFSLILAIIAVVILGVFVNPLTAYLSIATLVGYAFIYTMYLKRATPQNIVIGGLSGAAPPLLGWTAISGDITAQALLLVLIIFTWTPPHFWALAIYRHADYAKADIPMLPVTHGIPFTKLSILLYTVLLTAVSILPFAIDMSGWLYCGAVLLLDLRFLQWAIRLYRTEEPLVAMQTFRFSITYLMLLFLSLIVDHYLKF